ncbi:hypothetical protein [Nitrosomonas mobilis]|uniref:Uncharacterized protein n=1 Tax=Nitrosomonas mobilis TaxID=51642 RepID=A0A1G5SJ75_9PROT|nr:hypothetical protein [Nitrosomonas mobilis]SCZ87188.1 hypothetical protein NSMM_980005 [Nitrosomonas mobilis]HNO75485.1 hypothetical protein [Nitrosomonas mobilis]
MFIIYASSTRDATATFYGYLCGLFQSEWTNVLRMGEVSEVDHHAASKAAYSRRAG